MIRDEQEELRLESLFDPTAQFTGIIMEKELLRTGDDPNLLVFNARLQEKVHAGRVLLIMGVCVSMGQTGP
jgi:hypothetical protein